MILIHTPYISKTSTKAPSIIAIDILKNDKRIKPNRVLIDHCEEHTIRIARDNGFWAGLTIYPVSKVTPARGVDILEQFGPQMIMVNSAADWGGKQSEHADRHLPPNFSAADTPRPKRSTSSSATPADSLGSVRSGSSGLSKVEDIPVALHRGRGCRPAHAARTRGGARGDRGRRRGQLTDFQLANFNGAGVREVLPPDADARRLGSSRTFEVDNC